MRLLFLTETIPFPLDSGGRIKTYHTLRALAPEHDVHCHAFIRDEAQRRFAPDLAACCHELTLHLKKRSYLDEGWSLLAGYLTGTPFLVRRHFDPRVLRDLETAVGGAHFDAVYCDHLSMLDYGRRLRLPIIYDAHNLEFEIIRRHASTLRLSPARVPAEIEWRMLRRYERRMFPRCGLIYSVSEVDARVIRAMSGESTPVEVVPISVDAMSVPVASPAAAGHELLFIGGLHWPPNADAVRYFLEAILPLVVARVPDVRLTVVGRATPAMAARAPAQVTFVGHVSDIEPYFRRSRVMVVPLRAGSGIRVKILDALARGIPIVTTGVGCEGLDVEPGTHLLKEETPEAFADAIVRLLQDDELCRRLSIAGRQIATAKYDASVVRSAILSGLDRSAAHRTGPVLMRQASPCP